MKSICKSPIENRTALALEYFDGGFNCAQSVVMAYCDLFGLEGEQGRLVAAGYGGGIAATRAMCGTVNALVILGGLKFGNFDNSDNEARTKMNRTIVAMLEEFRAAAGSDVCKELLGGIATWNCPVAGVDFKLHKRPCAKLVVLACSVIEKYLL